MLVQVQVQRLHSFHELLGIVDRLQHYCSNQKLRHVGLGAENRELSADENFIQARNEHESLKATLLTYFQHPQAPGAEHKIVVAVLSNYVTTIQANQIHKTLNLAFHPETVGIVVPDGSTWPSAANVSIKSFTRKL